MIVPVTSLLPLLLASLAHSTLRMVIIKQSMVPSCKWSIQVPLTQWRTLFLPLASHTPRPPGVHQGQQYGQGLFCFSSSTLESIWFIYMSQTAKYSHIFFPTWSACLFAWTCIGDLATLPIESKSLPNGIWTGLANCCNKNMEEAMLYDFQG